MDARALSPTSVVVSWGPPEQKQEEDTTAGPWVCSACTFENDEASAVSCQVCGNARRDLFRAEGREFQLKFARAGKKLASWKHSEVTQGRQVVLENLEPNAVYKGVLRVRAITPEGGKKGKKKDKGAAWQDLQPPLLFRTFSSDEGLRQENLSRVSQFLGGTLKPYEEDPAVPDLITDKLMRAGSTFLQASKYVGIGGYYARLARQALALHRSGFAAVIFREDIQKLVIALAGNVGQVAREFGLSRMDVTIGCYYMIYLLKKDRLMQPEIEHSEHAAGSPGILQEKADQKFIDDAGYYVGFAKIAYRKTAAQMQWVLRNYPKRGSGYELIACKIKSDKFRPAFALMANRNDKKAVLAIRGTSEADDVFADLVYEFTDAKFNFHSKSESTFKVHQGIFRAARWMVRGQMDDGHKDPVKLKKKDIDQHPEAGAGLGSALADLHKTGYQVTITGHSLGGAVGAVVALIIANEHKDIIIDIYAYGSPPSMEERLAEACKGRHLKKFPGMDKYEPIEGLGSRVTVFNYIFRDDIVPRLNYFNARVLASNIKDTMDQWKPLMKEDRGAYASRAKTLWAPPQRGHYQNRRKTAEHKGEEDDASSVGSRMMKRLSARADRTKLRSDEFDSLDEASEIDYTKLDEPPERLHLPGLCMHVYMWRGAQLVSLADYRFHGFRRIECSESLIEDHRINKILESFRNVNAVYSLGSKLNPPEWQGIEDHMNKGLFLECSTCGYFVGWHYTGESEAVEIRAAKHCRSCGLLVCGRCSERKMSLPEHGILHPVRVCDVCYTSSGL